MIDPANLTESDSVLAAKTLQRGQIAVEIEALEMVLDAYHTESAKIRTLKDQYNLLLDQEEEIDARPPSDPLQILPPELWPAFLPQDNPSDLLILTLVCTRWRDNILSTPILWSHIKLDSTQEDYLSRAVTCLACSAPLEISVQIKISLELWKEIAPLIVAEGCRIATLQISPIGHARGNEIAEAREILSDFGSLPALKSLILPLKSPSPSLIDGYRDIEGQQTFSVDDTFFTLMPLLSSIENALFTTRELQIPAVRKFEMIEIHSLLQDTVDALRNCSQLKHLYLIEEKNAYTREQSIPSSLHSSLSSVEYFDYCGLALGRALPCIGSNLQRLEARYVSLTDIQDMFVSLQSFPALFDLRLWIRRTLEDGSTTLRLDNIHPLSIKSLYLIFIRETSFLGGSEELALKRGKAIDQLFLSLIHMMPSVDVLWVMGEDLSAGLAAYITSLRNLRTITFSADSASNGSPSLLLNTDELHSVNWYGAMPQNGMIDPIQSSTVRRLELQPHFAYMGFDYSSVEYIPAWFPRCSMPPGSVPNLRALKITVTDLRWDLSPFMGLKTLTLVDYGGGVFAGDIFDQLAIRLDICPLLEEISLEGSFVEWDLLILMLERRNLGGHPGVARIKSLQFDREIGYKLLRPITELLGGRYPHRDSYEEYSATAMGKSIWDKDIPGCDKCHRAFLTCSTLLSQPRDGSARIINRRDIRFGWEYPALHDLSSATPPLSSTAKQWLADKDARRRAFYEGRKRAVEQFHRFPSCGRWPEFSRVRKITAYSLGGVCFED